MLSPVNTAQQLQFQQDLGLIAGIIRSVTPPTEKWVLWAALVDPANTGPNGPVELRYFDFTKGQWVPLIESAKFTGTLDAAKVKVKIEGVTEEVGARAASDFDGNLLELLTQILIRLPAAPLVFAPLPDKNVGDTFVLTASGPNGTPISFASSDSRIVSLEFTNGKWLAKVVGAGTATITATQPASPGHPALTATQVQVCKAVAPGKATAYYGAFKTANPSVSELLAASQAQWDKNARQLVIDCAGQHPGWAEPKTQGIRAVLTNAAGFDNTSSFPRTSIVLNGIDYWLYVHEYAQFDPDFTENLPVSTP